MSVCVGGGVIGWGIRASINNNIWVVILPTSCYVKVEYINISGPTEGLGSAKEPFTGSLSRSEAPIGAERVPSHTAVYGNLRLNLTFLYRKKIVGYPAASHRISYCYKFLFMIFLTDFFFL